jgi:hypothetical protein
VTDRQIAAALGALDDVSIRQLEVAGERLMERRGALEKFGQVFIDVANHRDGGFGQAKWHLQEAIAEVDDRTAAIIENRTAPFWRHVRDALAERHP